MVWLLPLVLAALDDLMRQGRHWGLYGAGLPLHFAQLLYRLAGVSVQHPVLFCACGAAGQGRFGRRFAAFAASGVLAAGLSFFFFAAGALEVQESKGGLFDFTFSLTPQFNLLQLPLPAVLRQLFLERCHQRSAQHLLRRGAGAAGAAVLLRQCAPPGKAGLCRALLAALAGSFLGKRCETKSGTA